VAGRPGTKPGRFARRAVAAITATPDGDGRPFWCLLGAQQRAFSFERGPTGWEVTSVTNQSTGYCPEPDSWSAVARALDRIGVPHPGQFTSEFVFRRCPRCGERNIVREGDFICAICDAELPASWNFGS
jgi:hypothetical protein